MIGTGPTGPQPYNCNLCMHVGTYVAESGVTCMFLSICTSTNMCVRPQDIENKSRHVLCLQQYVGHDQYITTLGFMALTLPNIKVFAKYPPLNIIQYNGIYSEHTP